MEPLPRLSGASPGSLLFSSTSSARLYPSSACVLSCCPPPTSQGDTLEGQCPPQDQTEPNSNTLCLEKPLPLET